MKTTLSSLVTTLVAAGCGATPTATPVLPETCQQVLELAAEAAAEGDAPLEDGDYALYHKRDPEKPWTAYCADMDGNEPVEYLTLARTKGDYNFSELFIRAKDTSMGQFVNTSLRTHFERVRIDPEELEIQIDDRRFATSDGASVTLDVSEVTVLPFGVAGSCNKELGAVVPDGRANIDLVGTPFKLDTAWCGEGTNRSGKGVASSDLTAINIEGGAGEQDGCAWAAPLRPACPSSQPFTVTTNVVRLKYARN